MAQLIIPITVGVEEQIWRFMTEQAKNEDRLQKPEPLTDFYGEDRHELVQRLAYQHWEKRGSRRRCFIRSCRSSSPKYSTRAVVSSAWWRALHRQHRILCKVLGLVIG